MNKSTYFNETSTFLEGPVHKYQKSSLVDDKKNFILDAISNQMIDEKYFKSTDDGGSSKEEGEREIKGEEGKI